MLRCAFAVADVTMNTAVPSAFSLKQNYPNPFNAATTIAFTVSGENITTICIYNMMGQKVRLLFSEKVTAGSYSVVWDGKNNFGDDVASGVYFVKPEAGTAVLSRRMMLLR